MTPYLLGQGEAVLGRPIKAVLAAGLGLWPALLASDTEVQADDAKAVGGRIVFEDVTARAGLAFQHTIGDRALSSLVEATGVGCAFLDYDRDGWLDIFLVNGVALPGLSDPEPAEAETLQAATSRLFRNQGDGTFEDTTQRAGIRPGGYGMAALVGDYDNDGFPDLYVTQYGANRLYHNRGDGSFAEVAADRGVATGGFSVGACFLDHDRDGHLDLFVGQYVEYDDAYNRKHGRMDNFPGPLAYPPTLSQLYRNLGNGRFTDATSAAGIEVRGRAMGVGSFDYDADGWPDIFVSNDAMENHLFRNQGNGAFKEAALLTGVALGAMGEATGAMAVESGDVNGDGLIDFYVPDFTSSCLYVNLGQRFFDNQTLRSGIGRAVGDHIQWGAALADFDLDGDLDLYVSRGDANSLAGYPDRVLENDGQARFTDVSSAAGPWFTQGLVGRGVARGDYDNDGRVDLLVANLNGAPALLQNISPSQDRHWLGLELVGRTSNRDGIGARVRCRLGDRVLLRERVSGGSYCSSHDPRLHFGLGDAGTVTELEVHWPSGKIQRLGPVRADQTLTLREP
ncbi:MAG: CRTAC1 family protein [Verrucomicrobia bacterium]|nr:CRTAC1 family protein [Verrucomicrobiota bacterium]